MSWEQDEVKRHVTVLCGVVQKTVAYSFADSRPPKMKPGSLDWGAIKLTG